MKIDKFILIRIYLKGNTKNRLVYFSDDSSKKIYKIDINSNQLDILESYEIESGISFSGINDIQYDPSRNCLWITGGGGENSLVRLNLDTRERVSVFVDMLNLSLTESALSTYLSNSGDTLYISMNNSEIYQLNLNNNELSSVGTIAIGDILVRDNYNVRSQLIEHANVLLVGSKSDIYSIDLATGRSAQFQ